MSDPNPEPRARIPGIAGRIVRALDAVSIWSGKLFAWLTIPLICALVYEVVSRYGFDKPTLWASDISFNLYGAHFMLVAAFTLCRQGHIRTDFFYRTWPVKWQGRVDAVMYLLFYLPALALFFWASLDFAYDSWTKLETYAMSPWLHPIYPLKTVLPVSAALLILQGISELLKSLHAARTGEWP